LGFLKARYCDNLSGGVFFFLKDDFKNENLKNIKRAKVLKTHALLKTL
jgi:hypothetical protein